MSSIILNPFQLLELNIISAQDLFSVTRSMRTYAVAWVHPDRKLSTRVDSHGRNNPTWNDKFVFRVDDEFLTSDTSGVMIEIYATHWFKDKLVGRVRILVGNLVPPPSRPFRPQHHHGMRFAALQIRRPSGRPQGILNIGLAVLDSSMRSMPLYRQLSTSAVGYLNLMGEQNPYYHDHSHQRQQQQKQQQEQTGEQRKQLKEILPTAVAKPELRRTKSDTSSMHAVKTLKRRVSFREKPNSVINASTVASSSAHEMSKKGSTSMPGSLVNAPASVSPMASASPGGKGSKEKFTSTSANKRSEVAAVSPSTPEAIKFKRGQTAEIAIISPSVFMTNKKSVQRPELPAVSSNNPSANKSKLVQGPANSGNAPVNLALGFEATSKPRKLYITESELGPSPSEVAAAVAAKLKHRTQLNNGESSPTVAWSLNESEEGLQSKLERWRMELPPVYDRGGYSTLPPSSGNRDSASKLNSSSGGGKSWHSRRHTDRGAPGGGLFSCVGNICGCECAIVCGQDSPAFER